MDKSIVCCLLSTPALGLPLDSSSLSCSCMRAVAACVSPPTDHLTPHLWLGGLGRSSVCAARLGWRRSKSKVLRGPSVARLACSPGVPAAGREFEPWVRHSRASRGFSPLINLQVLCICSFIRGCATMVRVTCPSRAKPVGLACALRYVSVCVSSDARACT